MTRGYLPCGSSDDDDDDDVAAVTHGKATWSCVVGRCEMAYYYKYIVRLEADEKCSIFITDVCVCVTVDDVCGQHEEGLRS